MQKLMLLNTTVMGALPAHGETFTYSLTALTADEARALVKEAVLHGPGVESYVGHAATCSAMTTILGCPVPESRAMSAQQPGQRAIALKIRGRLPEGTVLDGDGLEAIGYDLYLITRE
ncbi:MAG: DUF1874 domain-containing protein [Rhodocyclaceae bacterium]|nr:MAG: DUF1874 domain-containing protein [Rhodocyclaceae bacterium]